MSGPELWMTTEKEDKSEPLKSSVHSDLSVHSEPSKLTETSEPSKSHVHLDLSVQSEPSKPTETSEPSKSSVHSNLSAHSEPSKPSEHSEPTETSKPPKPSEPSNPSENCGSAKTKLDDVAEETAGQAAAIDLADTEVSLQLHEEGRFSQEWNRKCFKLPFGEPSIKRVYSIRGHIL